MPTLMLTFLGCPFPALPAAEVAEAPFVCYAPHPTLRQQEGAGMVCPPRCPWPKVVYYFLL